MPQTTTTRHDNMEQRQHMHERHRPNTREMNTTISMIAIGKHRKTMNMQTWKVDGDIKGIDQNRGVHHHYEDGGF